MKPEASEANLATFVGVIRIEEQHIIQKTMARKRYPVPEKLLELDLDRTSLSDSSLSSVRAGFLAAWRLPLRVSVEMLSASSRIFLGCG